MFVPESRKKIQTELKKIKEEMLNKERNNERRGDSSNSYKEQEQLWKIPNLKSNPDEHKKSNKHKKSKKSKNETKVKSKSRKNRPGKNSSSDTVEEGCYKKNDMEREVNVANSAGKQISTRTESPLAREDWMVSRMLLPTYSKDKNVKKVVETTPYNPCKSSRELNPYWKNGGEGIPCFKIPSENEGKYCDVEQKSVKRNWKKSTLPMHDTEKFKVEEPLQTLIDSERDWKACKQMLDISSVQDKDLNKLGAEILKAEMIGDFEQVKTLKIKLEYIKSQRQKLEAQPKQETVVKVNHYADEDYILLSVRDEYGVVRPLPEQKERSASSTKCPKTILNCEKISFPDDDHHDLRTMFEKEKHSTSSSSNMEFLDMISRQKRKFNDLDDIFDDQIRKTNKIENKSTEKAIREHEKFVKILDSCDKCFYSTKLDREFVVSEGSYVYLAIPWHEGLQRYHCLIIPKEHISCSTRLDENVWSEITAFRKALCRAFEKHSKQCIFFETAVNLQRKPHCVIHCVPGKNFDVMPFYFKKAILESEKDWSINKQLITLKERSLRYVIPKELPYFWVNFGMENGFAHVIEDQITFPVTFAQEIIGNFLEMEPNRWRRPRREQNHLKKVKEFIEVWKYYDITKNIES